MAAGTYTIRVQAEDLSLRRQFEDAIAGKPEFVIQNNNTHERTDLLILELKEHADQTFDLIQNMLQEDRAGEIFLLSDSADQNTLINAMRYGAREFLEPRTDVKEIQAALERFKARQARSRTGQAPSHSSRVISVLGSKGGVGTTTLAVNLAVNLASRDNRQSVALLDMNLFGDIPLFLEITPAYTWVEITKNISRLDSTFLKTILAVDPSGVHVLPSPSHFDIRNMATPEIIERLLAIMGKMFDFIIVDAGQLLNETSMKVLELSDTVFMVTVQSLPCLASANKLLRTFRDLGFPEPDNVNIILNRHVKDLNIGKADVEKSLEKKLFWTIPNDYMTTISAINKGQPLSRAAPKKDITRSLRELSDTLVQVPAHEEKRKKKWWLF